jgi:hypothetical protein
VWGGLVFLAESGGRNVSGPQHRLPIFVKPVRAQQRNECSVVGRSTHEFGSHVDVTITQIFDQCGFSLSLSMFFRERVSVPRRAQGAPAADL